MNDPEVEQRGRDFLHQNVGPGGVRLHHGRVAEPVDHHAGHPVRLRVDQTVEGLCVKPVPMLHRAAQASDDEGRIHLGTRVERQHTRGDPTVHVDCDRGDRGTLGILQHGDRAGQQDAAPAIGHHIVEIDPGMAVADAAGIRLGFQSHNGAVRGFESHRLL